MEQPSNNSEKSSHIDNILYRAEKLREKSFYQQALRLFKKTLQGYTKKYDREGMFHCMLSLGDTHRMVGNFDLAAESYADAIEIATEIKSPIRVADAKVGLGLSLRAQGKWGEAIKLIRESKRAYEKKADRQGIAFTLWAEAGALRIKGDIINAMRTFKKSYHTFRSLKQNSGIGYCLCGLGGTSRIAGRLKDSLNYYANANKLFSHNNDTFGIAYSYCGIGNAYRMVKDYQRALINFSKAMKLYKKIGDKVSSAYTLWSVGTTYKMTGKYKKSHDCFNRAMLLFKKTKDLRGIIYCKLSFGELNFLNGRKTNAKKQLNAALHESMKNSFALEKCYATTLLSFINGKIDNRCYNKLRLKLRFRGFPFNIP